MAQLHIKFILGLLLSLMAIQSPAQDPEPMALSYCVYAPDNSQSLDTYRSLLAGDDALISVSKVDRLSDALNSTADILVIHSTSHDLPTEPAADLARLTTRNVIGIGYGAAKIFEACGLSISAGNCAHGVVGVPRIRIKDDPTIDVSRWPEPLTLFSPPSIDKAGYHNESVFGIYVGNNNSEARKGVRVLALFEQDAKYAPITRQNSAVLVAIDAPLDKWSADARSVVRELGPALKRSPREHEPHAQAAGDDPSPVRARQSPTPPTSESPTEPDSVILGDWANKIRSHVGTSRITVRKVDDKLFLDVWSQGRQIYSGILLHRLRDVQGGSERPHWFATHDSGFADRYFLLHLEDEQAVLEQMSIFKDQSNRQPYRTLETLNRSAAVNPLAANSPASKSDSFRPQSSGEFKRLVAPQSGRYQGKLDLKGTPWLFDTATGEVWRLENHTWNRVGPAPLATELTTPE